MYCMCVGPGLAFQVYPEAISRMMFPQIWAIFFFFMMCTLGFGSQVRVHRSLDRIIIIYHFNYLSN